MLDKSHLDGATLGNGDLLARLAAATAVALDLLDDIHPLDNLTKNNVLAVEPAGHDGGDEELGAVAVGGEASACAASMTINSSVIWAKPNQNMGVNAWEMLGNDYNLRARTSVSHGQQSRLGVLQLEVLVGKLLAVDGLSTGTL